MGTKADALDGFEPTEHQVRLAHKLLSEVDGLARRILYEVMGHPKESRELEPLLTGDQDQDTLTAVLTGLQEANLLEERLDVDGSAGVVVYGLTQLGAKVVLTLQALRSANDIARILKLSEETKDDPGGPGGLSRIPPQEGVEHLQASSREVAGKQDIWHVLPGDDGWRVKREGASRASSWHDTKKEAKAAAKDLARKRDGGKVVLHRQDGSFQEELRPGR